MTPVTTPSPCNSVHYPIEYVFDFNELGLYAVNDNGGLAQFDFDCGGFACPAFTVTPIVGERLYVPSGTYQGFHTIVSVESVFLFTTSTDYDGTQSGVDVKHIRIPQITLQAGYNNTEEYPTELPLFDVAVFTPIVSPEVDIRFDVSGFLKSIFTIQPPTNGIDFSVFNRFRLYFDGAQDDYYMVLNSSIPTSEIMSTYFGTGVYLSSSTTQILFMCGKTILSMLDNTGVVVNTEVENAVTPADYYYDDYNQNDYLTQIS